MARQTRVRWDITPALEAAAESTHDGLLKGGDIVKALAQQHVPLGVAPDDPHPGMLLASAKVDYDPATDKASVYYDTVYARKVHQNPKWHFHNGRQGKWLQQAAMKSRPALKQAFADAMRFRFSKKRAMPPGGPIA